MSRSHGLGVELAKVVFSNGSLRSVRVQELGRGYFKHLKLMLGIFNYLNVQAQGGLRRR